jgi:hypothetical protein
MEPQRSKINSEDKITDIHTLSVYELDSHLLRNWNLFSSQEQILLKKLGVEQHDNDEL